MVGRPPQLWQVKSATLRCQDILGLLLIAVDDIAIALQAISLINVRHERQIFLLAPRKLVAWLFLFVVNTTLASLDTILVDAVLAEELHHGRTALSSVGIESHQGI